MKTKTIIGMGAAVALLALIGLGVFLSNGEVGSFTPEITSAKSTAVIREPATFIHNDTPAKDRLEPEPIVEFNKPEIHIVAAPTELENSDPQFLLAAADLAPALSQWLLPNEQIRKWVLAIDLIADGKLPKRYRPVDYPMDKFIVKPMGLDTVAARENQNRMSQLITTITTINPEKVALYYQSWLPVLDKAYAEQGKGNYFDQRLRQAINQVLTAKPLEQRAALVRPSVLYKFEDPSLEKASDVEKILWRIGTENTESIQNFLRELRDQLPPQ